MSDLESAPVQVVVDRTKPITKDRIHDMLLGSGDE